MDHLGFTPSLVLRCMDREALIPIVDEHDRVIGTALRSEMRAKNLLHRCTAVLVLNTDNTQLLVHQRSMTKSVWPGWWDLAAGGVIELDEELEPAAQRELLEELGVTSTLTKLGSRRHTDADVDVFMHVWVANHNGPFTFVDGEVQQVAWLTPAELHRSLLSDSTNWCRDSVAVAWPLLQLHDPMWNPSHHE
jgi:isopentenyldiphosphate isomerase